MINGLCSVKRFKWEVVVRCNVNYKIMGVKCLIMCANLCLKKNIDI